MLTDSLSRKSTAILATMLLSVWSMIEQLRDLDLNLGIRRGKVIVASLHIQPRLLQQIHELQRSDPRLVKILVNLDSRPNFSVLSNGTLLYRGHLCVPMIWTLRT